MSEEILSRKMLIEQLKFANEKMLPVIRINNKNSWFNILIFFNSFDITTEIEYFEISMRATNDIKQLLQMSSFGKPLQHILIIAIGDAQ